MILKLSLLFLLACSSSVYAGFWDSLFSKNEPCKDASLFKPKKIGTKSVKVADLPAVTLKIYTELSHDDNILHQLWINHSDTRPDFIKFFDNQIVYRWTTQNKADLSIAKKVKVIEFEIPPLNETIRWDALHTQLKNQFKHHNVEWIKGGAPSAEANHFIRQILKKSELSDETIVFFFKNLGFGTDSDQSVIEWMKKLPKMVRDTNPNYNRKFYILWSSQDALFYDGIKTFKL